MLSASADNTYGCFSTLINPDITKTSSNNNIVYNMAHQWTPKGDEIAPYKSPILTIFI